MRKPKGLVTLGILYGGCRNLKGAVKASYGGDVGILRGRWRNLCHYPIHSVLENEEKKTFPRTSETEMVHITALRPITYQVHLTAPRPITYQVHLTATADNLPGAHWWHRGPRVRPSQFTQTASSFGPKIDNAASSARLRLPFPTT